MSGKAMLNPPRKFKQEEVLQLMVFCCGHLIVQQILIVIISIRLNQDLLALYYVFFYLHWLVLRLQSKFTSFIAT